MSCQTEASKVTGAGPPVGIHQAASKKAYVAGTAPQVSIFSLRSGEPEQPRRKNKGKSVGQKKRTHRKQKARAKDGSQRSANSVENLPTQYQIKVSGQFRPNHLRALYVQLALGQAAARRHIRELKGGIVRARSHGDPRPLDWAVRDLKQYEFLTHQLKQIRGGAGHIDLSTLSKQGLSELWAFARFEADRAHRNIDHLKVPGGPIGPPASHYLVGKHKLEAWFYTFLAEQIETIVSLEQLHENVS